MNVDPVPAPLASPIIMPVPTLPAQPPVVPKHFLAAFFLSFFLGVFGADRFYLGKYWSGVAKLLTFGLFGIGAIVDLALIMNGAMKDSHDRPLAGYEEYKGLAKRTVAWVTVGALAFVLINVVIVGIAIQQLISQLSGGDYTKLLNGGLPSSSAGGGSSIYNPYSL